MLTSTLGRKLIMALTGLFLILFLIVHLIGNLQLLKDDGGKAFNMYADFMGHNPFIQLISIGNFFFIALHISTSILLTLRNKSARPVNYAYSKMEKSSTWASRNMMLLGTIVLIFLVVHLQGFWAKSKFGMLAETSIDGKSVHNLYEATQIAFAELWIVALYVLSMAGLAFHLFHGFQSIFQTLGLNHKKYRALVHHLGVAFAAFVPTAYAAIPVLMYLKQEAITPMAMALIGGLSAAFSLAIKPRAERTSSEGGAG
ncbi:MAG: succinate dehydrogenase cytochrome b subunit [Thermonemataceae bacterium]|nr:succinate dehydrogenase cytochrome b subunit [Thermonemataceae bacterium]